MSNGEGRCGHHSDYIDDLPEYSEIPEKYRIEIDIMIEAKMKEKLLLGYIVSMAGE